MTAPRRPRIAMRWLRVAPFLALLACGGRSDLDEVAALAPPLGGGAAGCATDPPPRSGPCAVWQPRPARVVSGPAPENAGLEVAGAIRSGCGLVTAWYTLDSAGSGTLTWATEHLDFDGAELAPPITHSAITASTHATASLSLAGGGHGIGALEFDETGCRFVALDPDGRDSGGAIELGDDACGALAPRDSGWSYIRAHEGVTPAELVALDPESGAQTATPLATPAGQVVWDRLVLSDGSFLLDTFREDDATSVDTNWLQPFDRDGAELGPQIENTGFDGAPVWLAPTATGALAAWSWDALVVVPIDRSGAPTEPPRNIVAGKSIYEMTLLPAPDGDIVLVWTELEQNSALSMFIQALAADGAPRGPATLLGQATAATRIVGAVDAGGGRATLVMVAEEGVEALPLVCAQPVDP